MRIEVTQADGRATITLAGKLSVATSPELETTVSELSDGVSNIDMDLSKLEYISSAGLRVLVATEKRCVARGGRLHLMHPTDEVMEVFDMTGLAGVFSIEA